MDKIWIRNLDECGHVILIMHLITTAYYAPYYAPSLTWGVAM
jgi:hypothetical protein